MKQLFLGIVLWCFALIGAGAQGRVYIKNEQGQFVRYGTGVIEQLRTDWINTCNAMGFNTIAVVTSTGDENSVSISGYNNFPERQHEENGTWRSAVALGGYIVFEINDINLGLKNYETVNGENVFVIKAKNDFEINKNLFVDGSKQNKIGGGSYDYETDNPQIWIDGSDLTTDNNSVFFDCHRANISINGIGFKNYNGTFFKLSSNNITKLSCENCVITNQNNFSTTSSIPNIGISSGAGGTTTLTNEIRLINSSIGVDKYNSAFYSSFFKYGIIANEIFRPATNCPNLFISFKNSTIKNCDVAIKFMKSPSSPNKLNYCLGQLELINGRFLGNETNISYPSLVSDVKTSAISLNSKCKIIGTFYTKNLANSQTFSSNVEKMDLYETNENGKDVIRYVGSTSKVIISRMGNGFGTSELNVSWEYDLTNVVDRDNKYFLAFPRFKNFDSQANFSSASNLILDIITITPPVATTFCPSDAPISLSGNDPLGVFSGSGITGSLVDGFKFDPALAGPGSHTINYSCGTSITLTVRPVPIISVTEQLKTSCHANNGKVVIELSGKPAVTRNNGSVKMEVLGTGGGTISISTPPGSGNTYIYDDLGKGDYRFSAQYVSSNGEPSCPAEELVTISQDIPYLSNVTNADLSNLGTDVMCPAEVGGGFNYGPTGENLSFVIRNNNLPIPGTNKAVYSVRYTDERGSIINTSPVTVDYNNTITLNYNTPTTYAIRIGGGNCSPVFNEPKLELRQIEITPKLYKNIRYNSSSLFRYSDPVGQYSDVSINDESISRPVITVRRSDCQSGKLLLRLESVANPSNPALYNSSDKVYAIMEKKEGDNWITIASGVLRDGKISVTGSYPQDNFLNAPIEFSFTTGTGSNAINEGEYRILHAVERYGCSKPFYFAIVNEEEPVRVVFDVRHVQCEGGKGSIIPIVTGGDEDLSSFVVIRVGTTTASDLNALDAGNYELQSSCRKYLIRILDYNQKSLLYPLLSNEEQREVRGWDENLKEGVYDEEPAPRQPSAVKYTNTLESLPSCDNPATLEISGDYAPYKVEWKEWKGTPLITADENKLEIYFTQTKMSDEEEASGKWDAPTLSAKTYRYTRKKTVYTQGDKVYEWKISENLELRPDRVINGIYNATFQPNKPGIYTATVFDGCGVAFNMDNTLSSSNDITNFTEIGKVRRASALIYKGFIIPFPTHDFSLCYAWKNGSDDRPQDPSLVVPSQSSEELFASQTSFALSEYAAKCAARKENIGKQFGFNCLNINAIKDQLSVSYPQPTHHHTLYFYDRAGRLVRTVAPEGVRLRGAVTATEKVEHKLATDYTYNNLGQILSQQSPDGGLSRLLHDSKGRMRFSQDARQREGIPGRYAYTLYDALGRVVEGGEAELGQGQTFETLDPENSAPPAGKLLRHTRTHYHEPSPYATYLGKPQRYLDNRVGYSETFAEDGSMESYAAYSYDPHGNVEWLANELPAIGLHTMGYQYDLLSNKVTEVVYDEGMEGQLYHRYGYDEDQRLTWCRSSRDGHLWVEEALYGYETHGPLGEVILGHGGLQRLRHTYTIQGWLKAINMQEAPEYAGGQWLPKGEGDSYAQPVYAMALGYYSGDFNRSFKGTTSPLSNMVSAGAPLYNGNISSWTQGYRATGLAGTSAETYTYDRLNRIMNSRWSAMTLVDGTGKYTFGDKYSTDYSYDGNGNLKSLLRRQGDGLRMDELSYNYKPGTNRLLNVADGISTTGQGYGDLQHGQAANNYDYDASGNLKSDLQAKQSIIWDAQGKVIKVVPDVPSANSPTLYFRYDGMGQRMEKRVDRNVAGATDPTNVTMEYYVRDATGNVMAVYRRSHIAVADGYEAVLEMGEQPLYGSSRLGVLRTGQQLGRVAFAAGGIESVRFNLVPPTTTSTLKNWAVAVTEEGAFSVNLYKYSQTTGYSFDKKEEAVGIVSGKIAVDATGGVYSYIIPKDEKVQIGVRNYNGTDYPIFSTRKYGLVYNGSLGLDPTLADSEVDERSGVVWVDGMLVGASNGKLSFTSADGTVKSVEPGTDWFAFTGEMAVSEDKVDGRNYVYAQKNTLTEDIKGLVRIDAGSLSETLLAEVPSLDFDCKGMIDLSPSGSGLAWVNGTAGLVSLQEIEVLLMSLPNSEITRKIILGNMDIRTVTIAFSHDGGALWTSGKKQDGSYVVKVFDLKNGTERLLATATGAVQRGADGKMYVGNKINGLSLVSNLPLLTTVNVPSRIFTGYQAPLEGTVSRTLNQREYEINDHLGNVKVVVADYKTKNSSGFFESPIVAAFDYYAGGMQMPGRSYNGASGYRYGYQGSEKTEEINSNHYTTHFRELDVRINRWWAVDPKGAVSPWVSPYATMSNSPIVLVDPLGDKEYKSERQFARQNKGKTWGNDKGEGDWLKSDRVSNTGVWKNANTFNLQNEKGYNEYSTISERRDFYQWFQNTTEQQGSETKWAGAAAIISGQMAQVEDPLNAWVVGQDVVNFAHAGNKAIFNDVFVGLKGLYNKGASGSPLKGEAAKLWDANTLYKEQFITVQPIYQKQNANTIMELTRMAKGEGLYGAAFLFQEELKFKGNVSNPQDRYNHGMNRVVPYYNKWKYSSPGSAIRFNAY